MSRDAKPVTAAHVDSALEHVLSEARALASDARRGEVESLLDAIRALEAAIHDSQQRAIDETRRFAHELRSPLNALAGWAQILRDGGGDAHTATQAAAVIDRSVAALAKTIQSYAG